MLPSPGWLIFTAVVVLEMLLVLILVMPMPSNQARGIVLDVMLKLWSKKKLQYGCWIMVGVCGLYCYDALATLTAAPVFMYTCEQQLGLFMVERLAYTTSACVFLFLVLRRLLDIQQQVYVLRAQVKSQETLQAQQRGPEMLSANSKKDK